MMDSLWSSLVNFFFATLPGVLGGAIALLGQSLTQSIMQERFRESASRRRLARLLDRPLLLAARDLENRLETIFVRGCKSDWLEGALFADLKLGKGFFESSIKNRGYFALSTIYVFAKYFAAIELLKDAMGVTEFDELKHRDQALSLVNSINMAFRSTDLFTTLETQGVNEGRDSVQLFRHLQTSAGDALLSWNLERPKIINFRVFCEKYRNDEANIRFWMAPIEDYLVDLREPKGRTISDVRYLRLKAIQFGIRNLIILLDKKGGRTSNNRVANINDVLAELPESVASEIKFLYRNI